MSNVTQEDHGADLNDMLGEGYMQDWYRMHDVDLGDPSAVRAAQRELMLEWNEMLGMGLGANTRRVIRAVPAQSRGEYEVSRNAILGNDMKGKLYSLEEAARAVQSRH